MPSTGAAKGETVTFRIDPALKAELTRLAEQDAKSLGELMRELAQNRVDDERRRAFAAEARRQSLLIAASATDPNSDEAAVMRWIEENADTGEWAE
jgi:hypothetical protein